MSGSWDFRYASVYKNINSITDKRRRYFQDVRFMGCQVHGISGTHLFTRTLTGLLIRGADIFRIAHADAV